MTANKMETQKKNTENQHIKLNKKSTTHITDFSQKQERKQSKTHKTET